MNIIQNLGLQIKYETYFKKIREDPDFQKKNLYIAENDKNDHYFLILVKFSDLNEENFKKIKDFITVQNDFFLNLEYIVIRNEFSFYFAFEYHYLTFYQFLNRDSSTTSLKNKLLLAKQFIEIVDYSNNNNLIIPEYDPNMFFVVERDSSLFLKYFYNGILYINEGNFLEEKSTQRDWFKSAISIDFLIVFKFFIHLFQDKTSKQNDNINELLNQVSNKDISSLLTIFLKNCLTHNANSFTIFINEFNKLLQLNDIVTINPSENRNDLTKNTVNKMYFPMMNPSRNNFNISNNFNNTQINMHHFVLNNPDMFPRPNFMGSNINPNMFPQPSIEMFYDFFKSMYNNIKFDNPFCKLGPFGGFPPNFNPAINQLNGFDFQNSMNDRAFLSNYMNFPGGKIGSGNNFNTNLFGGGKLNEENFGCLPINNMNITPDYFKQFNLAFNKRNNVSSKDDGQVTINRNKCNSQSVEENNGISQNFIPDKSNQINKNGNNNSNQTLTANSDEDYSEKMTRRKRNKKKIGKIVKAKTPKKITIKEESNELGKLDIKMEKEVPEKEVINANSIKHEEPLEESPCKIKIEKDFELVTSRNKESSIIEKNMGNDNVSLNVSVVEQLSNENTEGKKMKRYALSEEDKKMISMVEFPRRFKTKKPKKVKDENEAFLENKNSMIKAECLKLKPILEQEIEDLNKDKLHFFMKENFPNMYNLENYYTHIRLTNDRRKEKRNILYANIKDSFLVENYCPENIEERFDSKAVWKFNILSEKEVNDFIRKIEKIWPNDETFTQEGILVILMDNEFDCEKVVNLLGNKDANIISRIKDINKKNKLELEQINTSKTKNYILRNNK